MGGNSKSNYNQIIIHLYLYVYPVTTELLFVVSRKLGVVCICRVLSFDAEVRYASSRRSISASNGGGIFLRAAMACLRITSKARSRFAR